MRIATLVAAILLIAGCAHTFGGSQQSPTTASTTSISGMPPTASSAARSAMPAGGTPMVDVIGWIEAGHPADPEPYHSVSRGGVTTQVGKDIAFSVATGAVACVTDSKHADNALACLVALQNPPPSPATAYGEWKGGWVDFDGMSLQVGSAHADPGPFIDGDGPELANGDSLAFSDYRCRASQDAVVCVNYAHQSAVRLGVDGVEPFGCLRSVPPPDGVGDAFAC